MSRAYNVEFESHVRGGLPIIVKARMYPPEPEIGIFHWQAEPLICWPSGKPLSDNVRISPDDWERICRECDDILTEEHKEP